MINERVAVTNHDTGSSWLKSNVNIVRTSCVAICHINGGKMQLKIQKMQFTKTCGHDQKPFQLVIGVNQLSFENSQRETLSLMSMRT